MHIARRPPSISPPTSAPCFPSICAGPAQAIVQRPPRLSSDEFWHTCLPDTTHVQFWEVQALKSIALRHPLPLPSPSPLMPSPQAFSYGFVLCWHTFSSACPDQNDSLGRQYSTSPGEGCPGRPRRSRAFQQGSAARRSWCASPYDRARLHSVLRNPCGSRSPPNAFSPPTPALRALQSSSAAKALGPHSPAFIPALDSILLLLLLQPQLHSYNDYVHLLCLSASSRTTAAAGGIAPLAGYGRGAGSTGAGSRRAWRFCARARMGWGRGGAGDWDGEELDEAVRSDCRTTLPPPPSSSGSRFPSA
ncbi:hypothetical protein MSAN_02412100 [Mycena sanguinolenta]|uniref:Uncharacterized protein n=1 Tax=Mycena sanguinolenta TaxID=230812 RepID=A0A8H6X3J8_9AGAR|nr:hypothetical protein MSAN_02412100 [Mycena sanguinolenta]